MTAIEIVEELRKLGDPAKVGDNERFGIRNAKSFGISTPDLKVYARGVKKLPIERHTVAAELWKTGIYEARTIAYLIDDAPLVTTEQMDTWASDFDNWATVDGTCCYLFWRTPFAYEKAVEWAGADAEFVRRAGFSLMAYLAVHDKKAPDEKLAAFLPLIESQSDDERNFVKKAVNWALRQIGKRSIALNELAIATAERIKLRNTKAARWIASGALRELRNAVTQERLKRKAAPPMIPGGRGRPR